jgi:hypothetical protein
MSGLSRNYRKGQPNKSRQRMAARTPRFSSGVIQGLFSGTGALNR